MRWLFALCCGAALAAPTAAAAAAAAPFGYTYQPAYTRDRVARLPAAPLTPKPGDVILAGNPNFVWACCYHLARTGQPGHCAIVVALPCGGLGVLEAGHKERPVIAVEPLVDWLAHYKGAVWIRRRKAAIEPEQSARLTEFAMLNDRKPYAVVRLLAQLTPLKARGILRTNYLGKPKGIRRAYFCSEILLEALVYAGLLDAETVRPSATYPRELFFDRSPIPHIRRHPPLACDYEVPALWTRCPVGMER